MRRVPGQAELLTTGRQQLTPEGAHALGACAPSERETMQNALFSNDTPATESPRRMLEDQADRERSRRLIDFFVQLITGQPLELLGLWPWEMTRETWQMITKPIHDAYQKSIAVGMEVEKAFETRYRYTHNGYAYHWSTVSNSRHEVQVAYALLRGVQVPSEVMAQYPRECWEGYWMHGFVHLPCYVTTDEERSKAIAHWAREKARTEDTLAERFFHYQSEPELEFEVRCYQGLLTRLLAN